MGNAKVFSTPKQAGFRLAASEVNKLDDGQAAAMVINGDSTLTAPCNFILGSNDLAVVGGGSGGFKVSAPATFTGAVGVSGATVNVALGTGDFTVSALGAGGVKLPGTKTTFTDAGWPALAPRTVTSIVPPATYFFATGDYEVNAQFLRQRTSNASARYFVPLPVGATVTAVRVGVKQGTGSATPSNRPTVSLYWLDMVNDPGSTGTGTLVGQATDTTPDAGFSTYHLVGPSTLSHTVAAGRLYYVQVDGDNSIALGGGSGSGTFFSLRPLMDLSISSTRFI